MGGSDASRLHLRSDAASGVMPLGLSATYTAQAAGRRTSTQHDAKKARMKETRLGKRGRGDSHAEGGGACTRRTKRRTTPVHRRAPAALRRHDPATPNAHGVTPPWHRTSLVLWRLILVRDVSFEGAAWFFFLSGVEQTPVFVWRVVVVGGLCARRREVQIWCGDGPRCGYFT